MKTLKLLAAVAGTMLAAAGAMAQDYPNRPVRVMVGFPPGIATDVIARIMMEQVSEQLGQTFLIDNRPGASGTLAGGLVAGAAPDGYTLLASASGPMAMAPALYKSLPFDTIKSFTPVALVALAPQFLVAHPALGVSTLQELVAVAKARPGQINFGTPGPGVPQHVMMEQIKSRTGIDLVHVAYKGGPAAMTDLLNNQVSVMFETGPVVLPHVRAGSVKAIAVSSAKRSAAAPDVPSVAEQGLPDFDFTPWVVIMAPAGTPTAIVNKVNAALRVAAERPLTRDRLLTLGSEPISMSPDDSAAFVRREVQKWGIAVKESGAVLE